MLLPKGDILGHCIEIHGPSNLHFFLGFDFWVICLVASSARFLGMDWNRPKRYGAWWNPGYQLMMRGQFVGGWDLLSSHSCQRDVYTRLVLCDCLTTSGGVESYSWVTGNDTSPFVGPKMRSSLGNRAKNYPNQKEESMCWSTTKLAREQEGWPQGPPRIGWQLLGLYQGCPRPFIWYKVLHQFWKMRMVEKCASSRKLCHEVGADLMVLTQAVLKLEANGSSNSSTIWAYIHEVIWRLIGQQIELSNNI